MKIVLDASVVAKWFIEEENTEKAIEIRDKFVRGEIEVLVPSLLIYEIGNVFLKHPAKNSKDVENDFKALFDIGMEIVEINKPEIKDIHKNAKHFGITFYDAVYVTLALKEGCKLITADKKLKRKVNMVELL